MIFIIFGIYVPNLFSLICIYRKKNYGHKLQIVSIILFDIYRDNIDSH